MDSPGFGTESVITSELIDLDSMPLTVLRSTNGAALRQALQYVVDQAGRLRVNSDGSKGGFLID